MFLSILKYNNARSFLRKHHTQQKAIKIEGVSRISSAACIVNIDEFKNVQALSGLAADLNLAPDNFAVITYTKTPEKYKTPEYPLSAFKDFNWKLKVKDSDTKVFLDREYDVLINYFTKEKLPLLLLSSLTRARVRIGFKSLNYNYNDIIFKININNSGLFRDELLKYLKILNKI